MRCFRALDADTDPSVLLHPGKQYSTPWGEPDHGPCDKCDGQATCCYRCLSCIEEGSDPGCPACQGRVEFVDRCPACGGTAEITATLRDGVSAFPRLGGLYRYLVEREFDFDGKVIVELEADLGDLPDLDADAGAILVHPTAVVTRHAVDTERIDALTAALNEDGV